MKQFVSALIMSIAALAQMSVADACENWLESRKYHIAPRTFEGYNHHIKTFGPFFSGLLISDLDGDHLRRYQYERAKQAAPDTINKELGVIIQVRKRINRPIISSCHSGSRGITTIQPGQRNTTGKQRSTSSQSPE